MLNQDLIENKTLKVGIGISLLMALAGWVTYYLSGSEAMLLDGNFSFISVLAGIAGIVISKRKHKKTKTFPFGSYVYEALFVLIKGILILGVVLAAGLQNILKLIQYFNGETLESVDIKPIIIYSVIVGALCFFQFFFYKAQNLKINNLSSIIHVETKAALLDGFLSIGIGIVFLAILFIPAESSIGFLKDIGDALIVLIMCVVFFSLPLKIIKDAFIELSGGRLQDDSKRTQAEQIIRKEISGDLDIVGIFITKLGSIHFVLIYISSEKDLLKLNEVELIESKINEQLIPIFNNINLELILKT